MRKAEVLIIGRANVGKSGLFNAIVGKRQALISKIPGTTRDINFSDIVWKKAHFTLGDSAGLENLKHVSRYTIHVSKDKKNNSNVILNSIQDPETKNKKQKDRSHEDLPLEYKIELKTLEYLEGASVRVLVVDADTGLMPQDREIMKFLRARGLSFALAVNKVDGKNDEPKAEEFVRLHVNPTFLVSSISRRGIGDLLDYVSTRLPSVGVGNGRIPRSLPKRKIRVALIGRTNVGKSTLANSLAETSEMIVSATPHTTREPHATNIPLNDEYDIELIDTAGVRKKAKIDHFLEIAGVRMSLGLLKSTDVILFIVDLADNLSSQDLALARLIAEHRRSCIIVANKFDLVKRRTTRFAEESRRANDERRVNGKSLRGFAKQSPDHAVEFEKYIRANLPKLSYAPILLVSAEKGTNVPMLKPLIKQVYENTFQIFPEHDVNVVLQKSLKLQPPPIVGEKKRKVQVQGLYQNSKNPKEYILKVYTRDYTPPNFVKFIEKQIRTSLPLDGVPTYITVENTREG